MKQKNKRILSITLLAFLVGVVMVAGGVFFSFSLRNILLNQQKLYMLEITKRASKDFSSYFEREMQTLQAISKIFADYYSYSSLDEYLRILADISEHYAFEQTGISFINSETAYFENGENVNNFLPQEIINKALEGQSVVSNVTTDPFTKQPIIIYATPFIVNGKTEAILFATQKIEKFQKVLSKYKISGEGFVAVLNKKDQLIVDTSRSTFEPQNLKQILSLHGKEGMYLYDSLMSNINKEDLGVLGYVTEKSKEHKLISFIKMSELGLKDWHLIFVVPSKVVSFLQRKIFLGSLIFCLALLVSFALILAFIEKREQEQRQEIFDTAFKDPVTGSFTMARFREEVEKILQKNLDQKFALVIFDIDNFKLINDLYGFRQGDLVLNHMANVLEEVLDPKKGEIYCRLIGDIFLFLINYQEDKNIIDRVNKIYKAVQDCYAVTDIHYNINTCFGIYRITDYLPFYLMLDRASLAKKTAKGTVNQYYAFYSENYFKNVLQSKEIENSMQQSLKDDEFELYFQPKCFFNKDKIDSAEVLVRWNHRKMGLISPDQFIPIFEHNGFIIKLDFYVLEKALQNIRAWLDEGLKPYKLSINFSRLHFKDELSLSKIKILLDFYKIPAELIELEITESAVMNNTSEAEKFVQGLHELGISVAMDDFGSGFSSLNVLKDLPFDTLKIDKEFLRDFGTNQRASAILEGIINMLKSMNTRVVAEGIETQAQADFLTSLKCDLAQGFLYYAPMHIIEFKKLLNKASEKTTNIL